ncbi:MAG: hypothetical protein KC994_06665 [Candidatus Omnitrophica bacterium]|nr:hypothetical protein [Candidatus Omnitrophota bacterium]
MRENFTERMTNMMKSAGDATTAAIDSMSHMVTDALSEVEDNGSDYGDALVDTIRGTIMASKQTGLELGAASKGLMIGVLQRTKELGKETLNTIGSTSFKLVKMTAEVGGDAGSAARGAIEGAVDGVADIATNSEEAASAAYTGALEAAEEIGAQAVQQVRNGADVAKVKGIEFHQTSQINSNPC